MDKSPIKLSYKAKVSIFKKCISAACSANEASLLAYEKYNLNAACAIGGCGSDAAAWNDANQALGWPFSEQGGV